MENTGCGAGPRTLRIDCDECRMQHTPTCADCVVTFLCARDDGGAVVVAIEEVRALRRLEAAGLAPALRHEPDHQGWRVSGMVRST